MLPTGNTSCWLAEVVVVVVMTCTILVRACMITLSSVLRAQHHHYCHDGLGICWSDCIASPCNQMLLGLLLPSPSMQVMVMLFLCVRGRIGVVVHCRVWAAPCPVSAPPPRSLMSRWETVAPWRAWPRGRRRWAVSSVDIYRS